MEQDRKTGSGGLPASGVQNPLVLVVRFSSIGDVLLTTPVLRAIKTRWPGAHVAFLTKERFAAMIEGNPHVDELIRVSDSADTAEMRAVARRLIARPWHLVADLHGSIRSRLVCRSVGAAHTVRYSNHRLKRSLLIYGRLDLYGPEPPSVPERYAACLEKFGVELDDKPCELHLGDNDRAEAAGLIDQKWDSGMKYIAVAPGAAWPIKRWPVERFAEAAQKISRQKEWKIVLLGGPGDSGTCAEVAARLPDRQKILDLSGKLSLRGAAAAVERAEFLLTNDTGLMHVATAVGTPLTAVFGPTVKQFGYFPYRPANAKVVEAELWCRPCTHNGRAKCPLGHFKCMREVGVEGGVEGVVG
ncbi:MAG: glycosyltransferase family 9 protein [Candidatus Glassbacteria bacterium]|nr:glycosyltransferase family 9 protein [Candidatus Glassbacteria bacterium]